MMMRRLFITILTIFLHYSACAEAAISGGDLFGRYVGILHPSLSIDIMYSDNIYKTPDQKKSDFITTFSPSIWLSVPGTREKPSKIDVSNTTPGGLSLELTKKDTFRRYQTFFYYSPQVIKYLDFSEESIDNNTFGGVFQLNLRGGLSINFIEQYQSSHEALGGGMSLFQDKYTSNLVYFIVSYDMTEKTSLRVDFSNFQLTYNSDWLDYGNRADNLFAAYFYYKILHKTSLFGEIEYLNVGYDTDGFYDSNEVRYFAGVKWEITDKTDGRFKTGYGTKNFAEGGVNNSGDLILELKVDFTFTPKTRVSLTGLRRNTETTVLNTEYSMLNSFLANYYQSINNKITLNFGMLFSIEQFVGNVLYGNDVSERKDSRFRLLSAVNYKFNDRLSARAQYTYANRSSSVDDFDYGNNILMISITGSL